MENYRTITCPKCGCKNWRPISHKPRNTQASTKGWKKLPDPADTTQIGGKNKLGFHEMVNRKYKGSYQCKKCGHKIRYNGKKPLPQ